MSDPPDRLHKEFSTVDDFLRHLLELQGDAGPPEFRSPWVFRGHGDADWELTPSAWREGGYKILEPLRKLVEPKIKKHIDHYHRGSPPDSREYVLERAVMEASEVVAVQQFCSLADELGMHIPDAERMPSFGDILHASVTGYRIGAEMLRGEQPLEIFIDVPFAFAQHHGIPTRYLDWTRDPLISAFFAAEDACNPSISRKSDKLCVWATKAESVPDIAIKWVTIPRSHHHYLHAQHGLFCRLLDPSKTFEETALTIHKLALPVKEADALRRELFKRRLSRAHLMPTFDNVATVVRQRWNWY